MKKCVILSGAGISAESGLQTFRDSDGLWEGHRIEDVCTPAAFARSPQTVIDFYNERRRKAAAAAPIWPSPACSRATTPASLPKTSMICTSAPAVAKCCTCTAS